MRVISRTTEIFKNQQVYLQGRGFDIYRLVRINVSNHNNIINVAPTVENNAGTSAKGTLIRYA